MNGSLLLSSPSSYASKLIASIPVDINKFKTQSSKELIICAEAYIPFYNGLHKIVQNYLKLNAHNFVDCKQLFSCFSELSIK